MGFTAAIVFEVTELLACLEDGEGISALENEDLKMYEIVLELEDALANPDERDH